MAFAQSGAFAFDRNGDEVRVTLVRSSLYGYDQTWEVDRNGPIMHTDMGEHFFRFRFIFGEVSASEMDDIYAALIEPYSVLRENA